MEGYVVCIRMLLYFNTRTLCSTLINLFLLVGTLLSPKVF